jgi:hypothetical protein
MITMKEYYQIDRLKHLIGCLDKTNGFENDTKNQLIDLKTHIKKGGITVKYDYTIKIEGKGFGRLYPRHKTKNWESVPCYLNIRSDLRDFLLGGSNYFMVDISNCHPCIVEGLLDHYGIICPELREYNSNRKKILKDCGADKGLIGKVLNDCNYKARKLDEKYSKFFESINKCVFTELYPLLCKSEFFSGLYQYELTNPKKVESFNVQNTFMSLVYQSIESTFIKFAIDHFSVPALGMSVDAMLFDGLLICDLTYEDINDHNAKICEKFNEFFPFKMKLALSVKEFEISEQFSKIFNREPFVLEKEKEEMEYTDRDVAEYILNKMKDSDYIFKYDGVLWLYDEMTHSWKSDSTKDIFRRYLSECSLNVHGGVYAKDNTKSWNHYFTQFETLCSLLTNDQEKGMLLNNVKDIIPYLNGYYDCRDSTFYPHSESNDAHLNYFTVCCNRNFSTNVDEETFSRVKHIFTEMFNDDLASMDEEFSFYARALSGHVEDKVWLSECGIRNSGKGLKIDSLLAAFPGLVSTFAPNELVFKVNNDAERRMGFATRFIKYRLMLGSEISDSEILDGTLLKIISSGGDVVSGRVAYGHTESGTIKALFSLSCNALPKSDPPDALQNMLHYSMPCQFMDQNELDTLNAMGGNKLVIAKLKDPNVKDYMKENKTIDAVTKFVLSFYKTKKPIYPTLKTCANDILEDEGSVFDCKRYLDDVFVANFVYEPGARISRTVFREVFKNKNFKAETSGSKVGFYFENVYQPKLSCVKIRGQRYYSDIRKIVKSFDE